MAVATALTIAAVGAAAASTVMSFTEANRQKKMQREAELKAQEAMDEARKKSEVNEYDSLAIQKEPYELRREALLSAGAQAIQAGVEGESRGIGATAGRIMMAQNEAQAGERTAMGADSSRLAELSAAEKSRLRDINLQLDLEEVAGAQLAARDAQEARAAAIAQGMQGIQNVAQMGIQAIELYPGGTKSDVAVNDTKVKDGSPDTTPSFNAPSTVREATNLFNSGVITQQEYEDFMKNMKRARKKGSSIDGADGFSPNFFDIG